MSDDRLFDKFCKVWYFSFYSVILSQNWGESLKTYRNSSAYPVELLSIHCKVEKHISTHHTQDYFYFLRKLLMRWFPPTAWSRFSRRSSTTSSLRGIPLRWWLSAWMLWGSYVPGIVESLSRFSPHLLIARCPLVMTEDLLRDLVEYETYVQGQSRDD